MEQGIKDKHISTSSGKESVKRKCVSIELRLLFYKKNSMEMSAIESNKERRKKKGISGNCNHAVMSRKKIKIDMITQNVILANACVALAMFFDFWIWEFGNFR